MSYEEWVERWQKRQLNDYLSETYGPENDDEQQEEFGQMELWQEPEDEEIEP